MKTIFTTEHLYLKHVQHEDLTHGLYIGENSRSLDIHINVFDTEGDKKEATQKLATIFKEYTDAIKSINDKNIKTLAKIAIKPFNPILSQLVNVELSLLFSVPHFHSQSVNYTLKLVNGDVNQIIEEAYSLYAEHIRTKFKDVLTEEFKQSIIEMNEYLGELQNES